ncbi:MAG: FG-GAP repeat protein [Saprospiraceae bacterium]|nr:FG-GAP repeat protein [Candidatus Vicinibacter affinis]
MKNNKKLSTMLFCIAFCYFSCKKNDENFIVKVNNEVEILNSIEGNSSNFGISIAFDDDELILTHPYEYSYPSTKSNFYIYTLKDDIISLKDTLNFFFGNSNQYGYGIAFNNNDLFVGYRWSIHSGINYFEKVNNKWIQRNNKINNTNFPNGNLSQNFGSSMCINENFLFVSDTRKNNSDILQIQGRVFVYKKNLNWDYNTYLTASDKNINDNFGFSIASTGDDLVIGAPNNDDNGEDRGSAYIFRKDINGNWTEIKKILNSDGNGGDEFGKKVAISQKNFYISAPSKGKGVVYVVDKLTHKEIKIIENPFDCDNFGKAIAVINDKIAISSDSYSNPINKKLDGGIALYNENNLNEPLCFYKPSSGVTETFASEIIMTPNLIIANYPEYFYAKCYIFKH